MQKHSRVSQNIPTEELSYPCPNCGQYNLPYMHTTKGFALMRCSKCLHQYKTSTAVSANFRKFCAKVGSQPNRSPTYYTSSEEAVRKYLERVGFEEGLDFQHNVRFKNRKENGKIIYYWADYYFPRLNLIIEVSPSVWHKLWAREAPDQRKKIFFESKGLTVVSYDDVIIRKLRHIKKPKKEVIYLLDPLKFVRRKPLKESTSRDTFSNKKSPAETGT